MSVKIRKLKSVFRVKSLKIYIIILISAFCLLPYPCLAAPCYGTKMPKERSVFAGIQSHSIFKRYLENSLGKLRSAQHFLLLSYGVFDWLSIDMKVGAGNIKQRPISSDEVDYTTGFAGGYGYRIRLYHKENLKMVFGFQHISVHPKSTRLGDIKNRGILDDWQYSLVVSKQMAKATPYLGTRWSRVDYIHTVGDSRKRVMSDLSKSIGLIAGLDLPLTEKIWVNLEGQFIDSQALALSLNYSF